MVRSELEFLLELVLVLVPELVLHTRMIWSDHVRVMRAMRVIVSSRVKSVSFDNLIIYYTAGSITRIACITRRRSDRFVAKRLETVAVVR